MNWNLNINKYFCNELHFKRLEADKCLYDKGSPHERGDYVIIALYVDDINISSNNTAAINKVIDQFKNRYKMKVLGTIQPSQASRKAG